MRDSITLAALRSAPVSPHRPRPRDDHDHLWRLQDGTGLHVAYGTTAVDPSGSRMFCHLCGRGFVHLGAHIRVHGLTAVEYRELVGLRKSVPLTVPELSQQISRRQLRAYLRDEAARARLAPGHQMARDGTLTWLARKAGRHPELAEVRAEQLATGRATQAESRRAALAAVVATAGFDDLHAYLRTRYDDGASLETLAADTGLGRARLREQLVAAGVVLRPPGHNTEAGKQARVVLADRTAAEKVGANDIRAWLTERHGEGWTLQELATAVGRSIQWVRSRLGS